MRRASLDRRIDRLAGQPGTVDLERTVVELAVAYGLEPAEIRAELEDITARIRRSGPETSARVIARYAEEFRLPGAELWAEYEWITGTVGMPR